MRIRTSPTPFDPLLKPVSGRVPDEAGTVSHATLSHRENAVDFKADHQHADALVHLSLDERGHDGVAGRIVLDFHGTDDPAHGQ